MQEAALLKVEREARDGKEKVTYYGVHPHLNPDGDHRVFPIDGTHCTQVPGKEIFDAYEDYKSLSPHERAATTFDTFLEERSSSDGSPASSGGSVSGDKASPAPVVAHVPPPAPLPPAPLAHTAPAVVQKKLLLRVLKEEEKEPLLLHPLPLFLGQWQQSLQG